MPRTQSERGTPPWQPEFPGHGDGPRQGDENAHDDPLPTFSPLFVIVTALLLSACGGGGGGSSSPGTDPTPTFTLPDGSSPETNLFFYDDQTLSAIEPSAPLDDLQVATGIQSNLDNAQLAPPTPLIGGDWNTTEQAAENPAVERVVYADSSGQIFQVSTEPGTDYAANKQQVSQHSGSLICNWNLAPDFNDISNAAVLFKVEDGNGECAADDPTKGNWRATRLGHGDTISSQDFPGRPLRPVFADDGSFDGYLAFWDSDLVWVDTDFTPIETLKTGLTDAADLAGQPAQAGAVIADNELCIYERDSQTPDNRFECTGHTFEAQVSGGATRPWEQTVDGEILYFLDKSADGYLFRVDMSQSSPSVETIADPDVTPDTLFRYMRRVTVTPDHVVWTHPRDTNDDGLGDTTRVVSYERGSGGASTAFDVDVGETRQTLNPMILRRSGGWFFYTRVNGNGNPEAVARAADGSGEVRHAEAYWAGGSYNTLSSSPEGSFKVAHLIDGVSDPDLLNGVGGATLRSVPGGEPGTGSVDHGVLDAKLDQLQFLGLGYGLDRLMMGIEQGSEPSFHVYSFDSASEGSLEQVDSDTKNHNPVLGF